MCRGRAAGQERRGGSCAKARWGTDPFSRSSLLVPGVPLPAGRRRLAPTVNVNVIARRRSWQTEMVRNDWMLRLSRKTSPDGMGQMETVVPVCWSVTVRICSAVQWM